MSSARAFAGLLAGFAAVALFVLAPARGGEFVSDDLPNVLYNPFVQTLSLENLAAILDPRGAPAANTFNYAPVHSLALALEWRLFGEDVRGYHVAQALVHAVAATLLAALLATRGLPFAVSAAGGLLFLVHPANVEASAWIFQIKSTLALALALGALWLHPRRPALGLIVFALALLTKASAAFALPMAIVFSALERDARGAWRARAPWLIAWTALLLPYAWIELGVLSRMREAHAPLDPDRWVAARSVIALAGRYLAMAASGWGVSPSHDVARARSWLDPWWLVGLVGLLALGARTLWSWRARREECAWWIGAAAAWLPTSQIGMSFLAPFADRYLYFALPGLIGGVAFAARDAWRARAPSARVAQPLAVAAGALALLVLAGFAWRSHAQARVWRSAATLALASAARYPDGLPAQLLAAQRAALQGDAAATVTALRAAVAHGYDRFDALAEAPSYEGVRRDPGFQQLLREMAQSWTLQSLRLERPTQADLLSRANAFRVLGDRAGAIAALDAALALGGPLDPEVRTARLALGEAPAGGQAPIR